MRAALIAAICTLVLLGTVYTSGMADGDLFWQMSYGRYMLDHHTLVPDHTQFSWSKAGNDVIYCAWTAEILFDRLYQLNGLPTIYLFRYLVLLAMAAAIWRSGLFHQAPPALLALGVTLCLVGASSGAYLKPELFSVVFFALAVLSLYRFKADPKNSKLLLFFPLLILVWVNTHGGFVFAGLLYALFLLGEGLNRLFKRPSALTGKLFLAMLGVGLAVFCTPYGYRYPVQLVQDRLMSDNNDAMMRYVSAWSPSWDPQFAHLATRELFVILTTLCLFTLVSTRRLDFTFLFHNIAFAALFLAHARVTYLWPLVAVASCYYLLDGRPWGKKTSVLSLILCLLLSARMAYLYVETPVHDSHWGMGPGYNNPVVAAELIAELPEGTKVANDYAVGGYLMWYFYPQRRVMIDPRGFPYREWFETYLRFGHGDQNLKFLEDNRCQVVVTKTSMKVLINALKDSPDWRPALLEPGAVVFLHSSLKDPALLGVLQHRAYRRMKNARTNRLVLPAAINFNRFDWARGFLKELESQGRWEAHLVPQRHLLEAVVAVEEKRYDDAIVEYEWLKEHKQLVSNDRLRDLYRWKIKTGDEAARQEFEARLKGLEGQK